MYDEQSERGLDAIPSFSDAAYPAGMEARAGSNAQG